jgi:hypothetical protein
VCDFACNNKACEFDSGDCEDLSYTYKDGILNYAGTNFRFNIKCVTSEAKWIASMFLLVLLV